MSWKDPFKGRIKEKSEINIEPMNLIKGFVGLAVGLIGIKVVLSVWN